MKKTVSLFLALCLAVSLVMPAALAEEAGSGMEEGTAVTNSVPAPETEEAPQSLPAESIPAAPESTGSEAEVQPETVLPETDPGAEQGVVTIEGTPEAVLPPSVSMEEVPLQGQEPTPEQPEEGSVSMEIGRSAFSGELSLTLEELPLDTPMMLDDSGEIEIVTQTSYQASKMLQNTEVTENFTTFGDQLPGITFAFRVTAADGSSQVIPVNNFGEIVSKVYGRLQEDVQQWENGSFYRGEPLLTLSIKRSPSLTNTMISVLMSAISRIAYSALDWDTPEMFYSNGGFTGTIRYDANNVYLQMTPLIRPGLDDLATRQDLRARIDGQVNKLTAAVAGKSDVDQARYFHDWLCENNAYNNNASPTANGLPWSSASALLGNSGTAKQGPVCEGYARAFQTLCDKVGIPCTLVVSDDHMWNNVVLQGVWTGVDVTWDDQESGMLTTYFMDDHLNGSYGHQIEQLDIGNGGYLSFAYPKLGGKRQLTGVEAFVDRLYRVVLGRDPDPVGFRDQVALLKNHGTTGSYLASQFFLSPEYLAKNKSDDAFLDDIYAAFFNRPPDEGGKANWKKYFAMGVSHEFVLERACTSQEFTDICKNYGIEQGSYLSVQSRDKNADVTAFVNKVYTVVLGRQGEEEGLNNWTGLLLAKQITGAYLVNNAYFCEEYEAKHTTDEEFVTSLYYFLVDRAPDAEGMANWMGLLKEGHSRRFVVARCVSSEEFSNVCARYGIERGTLSET